MASASNSSRPSIRFELPVDPPNVNSSISSTAGVSADGSSTSTPRIRTARNWRREFSESAIQRSRALLSSTSRNLSSGSLQQMVSKARKPKFELQLKIIDLNNIPLVSGTSYVKWHLPTSTAAEHRGRTDRCPIHDHKVAWDYTRTITLRLAMDKTNQLLECLISFEVVQDYSSSGRSEKISLGHVKLNLAEYVDGGEGEGDNGEAGIVRRYLMQESKINSTLKIGISMKQLDGDKNYIAPPLKTASVFGGIAGIVAGERVDPEDLGDIPSTSKPRTAEHGDLQDMYRRALAASWLALPGDLPPDQCIEDIFAGGDGWAQQSDSRDFLDSSSSSKAQMSRRRRHHFRNLSGPGNAYDSASGDEGEFTSEKRSWHHRMPSNGSSASRLMSRKDKMRNDRKHGRGESGVSNGVEKFATSGIVGAENQGGELDDDGDGRGRSGLKHANEVDEFNEREDLIAWSLPGTVA